MADTNDLIRRVDAMIAVTERIKQIGYENDPLVLSIRQAIVDVPSAQPEIIRCKDCMNWDTTWQNDWAKNYHYCPMIDRTCNGDWYCADAERRTDGSD